MANKKISTLDDIELVGGTSTAGIVGADVIPVTDVSDTTGSAQGTTKKVTVADLINLAPQGDLESTNNLSDLNNAAAARTNLGLGTAATQDTGTSANNVVQLDGSAKLPAVDGSQLTGIAGGAAFYGTVSETTTARTLSDSDNGKVIVCTNASTITVTIPSTLTAGFSCKLVQGGAGIVGVVAGSGTTLSLIGGKSFTTTQYQVVDLINYASNSYVLDSIGLQPDPTAWSGNAHSLSFDGVSDNCSLTQTTFSASSGLTLSAWVNFSSLPNAKQPIFGQGVSTGFWAFNPVNKYFYVKTSSGSEYFAGAWSGTPATNTWYHFMLVDNASGQTNATAKAYINGSFVGNYNGTGVGGINVSLIARNFNTYFPGLIDEVAIWESDQTSNISTIYNSGTPDDLTSLSPLHWWRMGDFEGGATTSVKDQGGASTKLDLTVNGATASTNTP